MITLTKNAIEQIKILVDIAPHPCQGVRLGIKETGCSGNSYKMDYMPADDDGSADDKFEQEGAILYVPKLYSWMLIGTTVDYITDELGNSRFDFQNPNEVSRCGCGESFNIAPKTKNQDD